MIHDEESLDIPARPTCEDAAALQVVLASDWIGSELENANYHSVRGFLEELRNEAVLACREDDEA